MKSITFLIMTVLAHATFVSAGGKKNFVPGGTILDIQSPHGGVIGPSPRRARALFGRRSALNNP